MSRPIGVCLAAFLGVVLAAGAAQAQALPPGLYNRPNYGVGYQPNLSPYLNLANGGDAAIQYYLRTLPEINRRATQQIYGSAIGGLEQQILQPPPVAAIDAELFTPLATTGHPTAFGYTGYYFPNSANRPATGTAIPGLRR